MEITVILSSERASDILHNLGGTFGISILDVEGIIQYINHSFCQITQYEQSQLLHQSFMQIKFELENTLSSILETVLKGEVWKGEVTFFTPYKEMKWLYLIMVPVKNEYHEIKQIAIIANDITDYMKIEKMAEDSLYSLTNVKNALNEASIVAITDKNGYIEHVNDKFCEISQYQRHQLIGKTHRIINSRHHPRSFFTDMWNTITSGKVWRGEVKNRAKDGSYYWMNTTIVPVFNQEGEIVQFISIRTDITKRIEAESELARIMEDDFKKVVQNLQNWLFRIEKKNDVFEFLLSEGKFAEQLGLVTESVRGKTIYDVLNTCDAAKLESELLKAFAGKRIHVEVPFDSMYVDMMLTPVVEEGVIIEVVGSISNISDRKKAEDTVVYMAKYDALTNLANRNYFTELLTEALDNIEHHGHRIAVLCIGLDRFKNITDSLGHQTGDRILQKVARILQSCVDSEDVVARIDGDEFVLYISGKEEGEVKNIVERIVKEITNPLSLGSLDLYITPSIGVSMYPDDGQTVTTLMKNADAAMSLAKEHGRNNYQFYTKELEQSLLTKLQLELDLRKALEKNELELYYQPKVDIEKNEIVGAEALIRWNHPVHGLIPPKDFIPIAEESGLIIEIGEWVLRTACKKVRKWHDEGYDELTIAVNISLRQFLQKNLHLVIQDVLEESGIAPQYLELEITESMTLDADYTITTLNKIKALGVVVSIDDFGTGYSSLSYLSKFPVDKLKIDQSFVRDLTETNKSIIKAIIDVAENLKIKVVAEGVEEEKHVAFFKGQKCKEVQGYYFSRPVPSDSMNQILRENKVIS